VLENLIFPMNYHGHIPHLGKNILWKKAAHFLLYAVKFTRISNRNIVQATEAYSSSDLTKAKYSISRLSTVVKETVTVQISPSNFNAAERIKST
jgi:hypothetical protein